MIRNTNRNTLRFILSALILGVLLTAFIPLMAKRNDAFVLRMIGAARVKAPGGRWKPMKLHQKIKNGWTIETSSNSRVVLFYKGTQVRLASKTRIKIGNLTNLNKPAEISLKKGFSWYKVNKRKFRVKTPTAVASVRGTKFAVFHTKKGTGTCVCEGVINTSSGAGQGTDAKAGHSHSYNKKGKLKKHDYTKYFRGLKVDKSFKKAIRRDFKTELL